jgi:hypothetical protein
LIKGKEERPAKGKILASLPRKESSAHIDLAKEASVKIGTRFLPYGHTMDLNGQWSKLHVSTAANKKQRPR